MKKEEKNFKKILKDIDKRVKESKNDKIEVTTDEIFTILKQYNNLQQQAIKFGRAAVVCMTILDNLNGDKNAKKD